jgi:hypothetical protein
MYMYIKAPSNFQPFLHRLIANFLLFLKMSSISLTASVLATVCAYILVQSGDSCGSLASKCGISAADFTKYNPSSTLCSTLTPGEPVCCSAGSLPDLSPQPNANGTCYSYTVQVGDYCQELAQKYYITSDEIETYNAQTWAWMGCNDLQKDAVICLSSGHPPMPAPLQNAVCGPQVPGTEYPSQWSDISNLNPCPLNACVCRTQSAITCGTGRLIDISF